MAARGVVAPHRVFKLVCFLLLMLQKRKAVEAGVAAASKRVTSKAKGNGMAGGAGMKGSVKAATYVAPEGAPTRPTNTPNTAPTAVHTRGVRPAILVKQGRRAFTGHGHAGRGCMSYSPVQR